MIVVIVLTLLALSSNKACAQTEQPHFNNENYDFDAEDLEPGDDDDIFSPYDPSYSSGEEEYYSDDEGIDEGDK